MNFKIKFLLASFILIAFQKSSCMQELREIGSSAISGAAVRTLVFENLPGIFLAPKINSLKDKIGINNKDDRSLENKNKLDLKKWSHISSALINCFNLVLSSQFIFRTKPMNAKAQWAMRWVYLISGVLGSALEREAVGSLKDIKMLKKHEEIIDMSMPVILASLQYIISKE